MTKPTPLTTNEWKSLLGSSKEWDHVFHDLGMKKLREHLEARGYVIVEDPDPVEELLDHIQQHFFREDPYYTELTNLAVKVREHRNG